MGNAFLLSIGTAVPVNKVSQSLHFKQLIESAQEARQKRLLKIIYERSGISSRYSVLDDFSIANKDSGIFSPGNKERRVPGIGERMEIFEAHTLDLAVKAVEDSFNSLPGFEKSTITHLLTFSCTCEKALNLSSHDNAYSYKILNNYGNMSSVTVLFVLMEILQNRDSRESDKNVLSFAFGPGLTIESMILKIV